MSFFQTLKKLLVKHVLRVIIAASLSGFFLYIAFRSLAWPEAIMALQQFNPMWLLPVAALALLSVGLHALRWQLLLKPIQNISSLFLFKAIILDRFYQFG